MLVGSTIHTTMNGKTVTAGDRTVCLSVSDVKSGMFNHKTGSREAPQRKGGAFGWGGRWYGEYNNVVKRKNMSKYKNVLNSKMVGLAVLGSITTCY